MTSIDVEALLKEAEALISGNKKSTNKNNITEPAVVEPAIKLDSVKPKKKPVIKSGTNYQYDPKTYDELHKVPNWHLCEDVASLVEDLKVRGVKRIAYDTETTYLPLSVLQVPPNVVRRYVKKKPQDVPFGVSICDGENAWFMFKDFELLKEILEDESIEKIMHNSKFDMHVTENIGIKIKGRIHDTLVLLKLFNENLPSYALKDLAVRFIDKEANKYEIMKDNWMADHKTGDWTLVPKDLMGDYGCGDVWYTFNLFRKFYKYMEEYEMTQLYDTECALLHTAYGMERVGFKVDRAYLEQAKVEFEKEIAEKQQELYDLNGGIFNANSAQQLYNFFIKLGVDKQDINFTDKGNPCFDKTEKERLAKKYDVVNKLVDLGKLEKLYSSYIINILNTLPATGRIHCSINTCEATTGRMSITDPARRAS